MTDKMFKNFKKTWTESNLSYQKFVEMHPQFGFSGGENLRGFIRYQRAKGQILALANEKEFCFNSDDVEILTANVQLAKQKQRFQDINRIERKAFREFARLENSVAEYNKELIKTLKEVDLSKFKIPKSKPINLKAGGLVHITDLHLNELVCLLQNQFDFTIAAKRLHKYADRVIKYAAIDGINHLVIANTGDTINSDKRLDELLNRATNRTSATVLSVFLLEQFVLYFLSKGYYVTYATVSGNETRAKDEFGFSNALATDNYDFTVHNFLSMLFRDNKKIQFITGDPTELILNIAGQNVLMLHGCNKKMYGARPENAIQSIVGKFARKGIMVDYAIFGHFHSAYISDFFSRGSSLVGDNDYSDKGLELSSRASQNFILFFENGDRDAIKIDLQNYEGVEGFEINEKLEAYNAKSYRKLHDPKVVFQVVI